MSVPSLERESALWEQGYKFVAGLDEVGRGPLAGPVVASAVVFRPDCVLIEGLRDSKQLTARQRERLFDEGRDRALCWSVSAASVREIDRMNIRRASALAMRRCIERLPSTPDYLLVDGDPLKELRYAHDAIVGGDGLVQSIAAASVLAKVIRDRLMERLDRRYPGFQWRLTRVT